MRIITIRRNCQFLLQSLESASEPSISYVEGEYEKIASRLAKIVQYLDTQSLKPNHRVFSTNVEECKCAKVGND